MSISIQAINLSEVEMLSKLSRETFIQSHGHSADASDIEKYIDSHFDISSLSTALKDSNIYFSKIYIKEKLAGYTKLILNHSHPSTKLSPISKFERLYLLKDFYGLGLGEKLLEHNIKIAKANHQKALWLYVWTENQKGLRFYEKSNFKIIGEHDFKISDQHSNPNYVMLLDL